MKIYYLILTSLAMIHAWKPQRMSFHHHRCSMQLQSSSQSRSLPNIAKSISKAMFCAAWIGSCVSGIPSSAIAQPYPSFGNVPVAKLFAEAEEAIESTQSSYKALEKEWKDAQKGLQGINDDLVYAKKQLAEVEADLIKLEVKALQLFEIDKSGIDGTTH